MKRPTKKLRTAEIASIVKGDLIGDTNLVLSGISSLDSASSEDLSFFWASLPRELKKLKQALANTKAGAVLVTKEDPSLRTTQIIVKHPAAAIIAIANYMYPLQLPEPGIHKTAVIHETAEIHPSVRIAALVVVGHNVKIAENTVLFPNVVIYEGVQIGASCVLHANVTIREYVSIEDNCLIQSGATIGSDGFGYLPDLNGLSRISHVGSVVIENGVDVGANTTIDRGTYGNTHIKKGTKIDNLVMIGHNVSIGVNSILCGQVGIAGSSTIGSQVTLAGQVGVADHVSVVDNTRVAAKSGVVKNLDQAGDYAGIPAIEASKWRRTVATKTNN